MRKGCYPRARNGPGLHWQGWLWRKKKKTVHGSGAPRSGCCPSASSLKWAIAPTNTPSIFSCVCPTGIQFLRAIATSAARSSLSSNGWRTCACRSVVMSSSRRPRSQPKEADRPSRPIRPKRRRTPPSRRRHHARGRTRRHALPRTSRSRGRSSSDNVRTGTSLPVHIDVCCGRDAAGLAE